MLNHVCSICYGTELGFIMSHLCLIAALLLLLAVCSGILNYVISPGEIHCKYMVCVLHLRSAISMIVYRMWYTFVMKRSTCHDLLPSLANPMFYVRGM